jgi:hypothetical protein
LQTLTVEAEGGTFTVGKEGTAEGEGTFIGHFGAAKVTAGSSVAEIEFLFEPLAVGEAFIAAAFPAGTTITAFTPAGAGAVLELSNPATASAEFELFTTSSKEVSAVTTTSGAFHVGDGISGKFIPPGTTITAIGSGTLTLSNFPTEVGTVTLIGSQFTAPLAFNSSSGAVQSALEALPFLGPGSVSVQGGPGGGSGSPYSIAFGGTLKNEDVPQLETDGANLTGPHPLARVDTTVPGGPGTGILGIGFVNSGSAPSAGAITMRVDLPPSVVTSGPASHGDGWQCPGGAGESSIVCTNEEPVPGVSVGPSVRIPFEVNVLGPAALTATVTMSGGGADTVVETVPLTVSGKPASPGLQVFWADAFDGNGRPLTQAGGHPDSAMTAFVVNSVRSKAGALIPAADVKDVTVDLPPGFVGNPLTTPRCPQSLVAGFPVSSTSGGKVYPPLCNQSMIVGTLAAFAAGPDFGDTLASEMYNDVPAIGVAGQFTAEFVAPFQSIVASVRSTEDFGVRVDAPNVATYEPVFGSAAILFGKPFAANGSAFLANPTDCKLQREQSSRGEVPSTRIKVNTWQDPLTYSAEEDPLPLLTGCRALTEAWLGHGREPQKESPSFSFQPSTNQASSPAGATARLHIPQAGLTDPVKLRTSDLKKTIVTLPEGLSVNPSSANGLAACSESQVGYRGNGFPAPSPIRFDEAPVSCPDASKLGTVKIKTPLLEEELDGTIYLAAQDENPFNSLIALYLVVESPRFGLTLKISGEVRTDAKSGQLTAVFDNNPQLPFEDLVLRFRGGGGRSTLATPETCGHFAATGSLEPWSAENGEALSISEAGFDTGGNCSSSAGTRPFSPSFEAGTAGTQAGAYSPLVIKVARRDGEQELKAIDFTLPKGLTGKLAGIPYCSEAAIQAAKDKSGKAEKANASCPPSSQLGTVDTAAGVGSEPIHVAGKAYLAGPYEGAPLSSVVITPAVAGPFDLGNVVVRAPLFVDPETAQITAKSDPIPTILRGIPLKVRSVAIDIDRANFSLNPTNCEQMLVSASIEGSSGANASPSNRFQVGGCDKLKFKPRLKLRLKGSTKRIGHPALKAVVTYPKQGAYANIARAQVNLPHSEFLDQGNLNKTCTKPVLLAGNCSKKSIYGKAKAWTPLLDKPLQGPVYLVGGYGYKLPALVAELNGQIRVVLKGKVDSGKNKGIRNTFEAVPDAPVSRFVLEMKGGKKYGLLENSENLCKKPQRAIVRFTAQNGLVSQVKPKIANSCRGKKGKKSRARGKKGHDKKH